MRAQQKRRVPRARECVPQKTNHMTAYAVKQKEGLKLGCNEIQQHPAQATEGRNAQQFPA